MPYIKTITGNLLDFPPYDPDDPDHYIGIDAIAHSCNLRNMMGAGIAKQIKNRYPQAYEADTKAFDTEYDKNGQYVNWLGKVSKAEINSKFLPNDKGYIYNMYTQANIGDGSKNMIVKRASGNGTTLNFTV